MNWAEIMRVRVVTKKRLLKALTLATLIAFFSQEALTQQLASITPIETAPAKEQKTDNVKICYKQYRIFN